MVDDLRIRTPADDELDAVAELMVVAYGEFAAKMAPDAWSAFAQQIANVRSHVGDGTVWIAERDEEMVGAMVLYTDWRGAQADSYGVRMLAVPPAHRGTGVGSALMKECIAQARAEGKQRVVLTVTQEMESARDVFEGLGFERDPSLDHEPAPGVRSVGYALTLD